MCKKCSFTATPIMGSSYVWVYITHLYIIQGCICIWGICMAIYICNTLFMYTADFAEICIKVVKVQKYCTLKTGYIFLL